MHVWGGVGGWVCVYPLPLELPSHALPAHPPPLSRASQSTRLGPLLYNRLPLASRFTLVVYIFVHAALSICPILSFPCYVRKSVLYIGLSIPALKKVHQPIGLWLFKKHMLQNRNRFTDMDNKSTATTSSVGNESACNAGDPSSIPGSGRSLGEGLGYPLQYSWASLVVQLVKNLPAMWKT